MNISIEKLPKSVVKITVEISEKDVEKYVVLAVKKLNEQVSFPGFRPGHIPEDILLKRLGEEAFYQEVNDVALTSSYADTVIKEKLDVVSRPEIKIILKKPLKYEAVVAVMPEVDLEDYKTISIPLKKVEADEKDIQEELLAIQRNSATYTAVQRSVQKGDRVEIDFEGFDKDGKKVEGTHSKNHPVIVGNNALHSEFEEELIGVKPGETKEFTIQFTKSYHHPALQGKKVTFKVKVNVLEEVKFPELNNEFIKNYSRDYYEKEMSEEELKEVLRKNVLVQKESQERRRRENELIETLLKKVKVDVPDVLIEEQMQSIKNQKKNNKAVGQDGLREQAARQVTLELILKHIISKENIFVAREEIEARKIAVIDSYPEKDREYFKNLLQNNDVLEKNIAFDLLMGKFYNFFLDEKPKK